MSCRARFAFSTALLVAAALAAAGCGSQSHTPPVPPKLVATADPVCKLVAEKRATANAALRAVAKSTAKTLQVLARVAPPAANFEHNEVYVLSTLKVAGASASKDWQTMLVGLQLLANDTKKLGVEAKAKDIKAVRKTIANGHAIQKKLIPIAKRDGFVYCGRTS